MLAREQRNTRQSPCKVCSGHDAMPQGRGMRCWGFLSSDGLYQHCTNDQHAGGLPLHPSKDGNSSTYAHKLNGDCKCGVRHGAEIRQISDSPRARPIEFYPYVGLDGELVYEVVRLEPKGFRQRRPAPDGEWIWKLEGVAPLLYRLPDVIQAVAAGDPVWIAEGERDVHALEGVGLVATTNSGGAGKFPAAMVQYLAGADVTIVQDKDEPGRKHARDVAKLLAKTAKSVRIVEARTGKDARDHLGAKHSSADFVHVWPLEGLRRTDPIEWKRKVLRESTQLGDPYESVDDLAERELLDAAPTWPAGIRGATELTHFRGFTIFTGGPGAAKSSLALASSMSAALYGGWHVEYLSSELPAALVSGRMRRYLQGLPQPKNWRFTEVGLGASVETLIEYLCSRVVAEKTLLVFDSISSFTDQGLQMLGGRETQAGALLKLCMWLMNVRRMSKGEISVLALSEANAAGGTKYRVADHKADTVLNMKMDEYDPKGTKHMKVVKGWDHPPVGTMCTCALEWSDMTLTAGETADVRHDED